MILTVLRLFGQASIMYKYRKGVIAAGGNETVLTNIEHFNKEVGTVAVWSIYPQPCSTPTSL